MMSNKPKLRCRLLLAMTIFFVLFVMWRMIKVDENVETIEQSEVVLGEETIKTNIAITNGEEGSEEVNSTNVTSKEEDTRSDEEIEITTVNEEEQSKPATKIDAAKEQNMDDKIVATIEKETNEEEPSSVTPDEEAQEEPKREEKQQLSGLVDEGDKEEVDDGGWGHWKFYDGGAEDRPESGDYMLKYPNKDVPADDFPENAWQTDAVYVNHFIEEAKSLVSRATEAILMEYGHGLPRTPEQSVEAEQMFKIHLLNLTAGETEKTNAAGWNNQGGWTTERSFEGLSRRLLHAMMTHDTFTFILGGHSAAAGHGNHFQQSYMMQFHKVMEPIFERLGMTLVTRNLSQGGLGTMHNALGSKSIYGNELDMVLWDSKMTEAGSHEIDIFMRQVLLAGNRVPFVMCSGCDSNVMKHLHNEAMVDIGMIGDGLKGIPQVEDAVQANDIVWAARYMKCSREAKDLCSQNKYNSTCWIEREDVTPPTPQKEFVGGRASWHPGWRHHQLQGRVLTMWVLDALWDALHTWQDIAIMEKRVPLPEKLWHMTEYYNNIRNLIVNKMSDGPCEDKAESVGYPKRICRIGLNGKTEHTPRANPDTSSIRSIMKPPIDEEKYMPQLPDILYGGLNVPIPALQVPEGEVDVRKIASTRRVLRQQQEHQQGTNVRRNRGLRQQMKSHKNVAEEIAQPKKQRQMLLNDETDVAPEEAAVVLVSEPKYGRQPGMGWGFHGSSMRSGYCDGSYYSTTCGREPTSDCLLSGHNDSRGTLMGNGLSGWLLLDLGIVKHGIIILHIDFWHGFEGTQYSQTWSQPNNGGYERQLRQLSNFHGVDNIHEQALDKLQHYNQPDYSSMEAEKDQPQHDDTPYTDSRLLKGNSKLHDDFIFEVAINDQIVIQYNKDEYLEHQKSYQRVFKAQVIIDDENWKEQEVELGIRVSGCQRDDGHIKCSVGIGHVYWA